MTQRYRQNPTLPATVLGGEAALVTPSDNRMHVLNEVATRVWELCEGEGLSVDELVEVLLEEFDVSEEVARAETLAFVQDGVARKLLLTD